MCFRGQFKQLVATFVKNGGRIKFNKFNLTGVVKGVKNDLGEMGMTEWELTQILGSKLEAVTDFFLNGRQLLGAELVEALKAWR